MNKAEYKRRKDDIESQINNLQIKLRKLKDEYKTFAPFKVGDKVLVTNNKIKTECFIGEVKIHWENDFEYKFFKAKKDGSMGGQSASIFYPDQIELIEKTITHES